MLFGCVWCAFGFDCLTVCSKSAYFRLLFALAVCSKIVRFCKVFCRACFQKRSTNVNIPCRACEVVRSPFVPCLCRAVCLTSPNLPQVFSSSVRRLCAVSALEKYMVFLCFQSKSPFVCRVEAVEDRTETPQKTAFYAFGVSV